MFRDNTIEEREKYVAYNLENFVSDFGGLIGLFLGFSLLSIVELIHDFFKYCFRQTQSKNHDEIDGDFVNIFANYNSIPGIERIVDKSTKKITKILWIISILLSICGLIYYTRISYFKLTLMPEITLSSKVTLAREIPFPALTICTSTFPRDMDTILHPDVIIRRKDDHDLTPHEQSHFAASIQFCGPPSLAEKVAPKFRNRSETNIVKLLRNQTFYDEIDICEFRTLKIDCSKIINQVMTGLGKCWSYNLQGFSSIFNENVISDDFDFYKRKNLSKFPHIESKLYNETFSDENNDYKEVWSLENGYCVNDDEVLPVRASKMNLISFRLSINLENTKHGRYSYCTYYGSGYNYFIHLPNEMPSVLNLRYFLQYHEHRHIYLSAKVTKFNEKLWKYPADSRKCYHNDERKLQFFKIYTKFNCNYECMINYTLSTCGCVIFSMPRTNTTPVCDLDRTICSHDAAREYAVKVQKDVIPCKCYQPCSDIEYKMDREQKEDLFITYDKAQNTR
jgi:amiloride-sensitive sodium channel